MAKCETDSVSETEPDLTTGSTARKSSTGAGAAKKRAAKKKPCPFSIEKTRLTLLERIKNPDDRLHWDYFLQVYGAFIKNIARRRGLDEQRSEDLYIDILCEISRKIGDYTPAKGRFRSWLKTMVTRRCIGIYRKDKRFPKLMGDQLKREEETQRDSPEDRSKDPQINMEAVWDREEAEAVLKIARGIAKASVTAHNWQIFECRVLRDWPVARVCETLGVTPNVVNVAKAKVKPVLDAAKREAMERLDRGPLTPLDRKALEESLPLPTYVRANRP